MKDDYKLKYWLQYYGMPEENIEAAAMMIAQGYGASRYLEGVADGAEAVTNLAKEDIKRRTEYEQGDKSIRL